MYFESVFNLIKLNYLLLLHSSFYCAGFIIFYILSKTPALLFSVKHSSIFLKRKIYSIQRINPKKEASPMKQLRQHITNPTIFRTTLCILFIIGFLLCFFEGQALARTKVQSGYTAAMSGATHTESIEAVDLDKSFIIFQSRTQSPNQAENDADEINLVSHFNSSTQIQFTRDADGKDEMQMAWYVVESDAFQVEYFNEYFAMADNTKTVTLNNQTPSSAAVDFVAGKTFIVFEVGIMNNTSAATWNATKFTAVMSYDTGASGEDQLILTRHDAESSSSDDSCYVRGWVVRLMDDSTVYTSLGTMPQDGYFTTNSIKAASGGQDNAGAVTPVDRSKSGMFFYWRFDESRLDGELRGSLVSDTDCGYNRRGEGVGTVDSTQYAYVWEMGTLGSTLTGGANVAKGYLYADQALSRSVDENLSFAPRL